MSMKNWIENYLKNYKNALESLDIDKIESVIEKFKDANQKEKQIFVFGNGGSASNCSHLATDIAKGASDVMDKRFKITSLNENVSLISAIGNDYSYEDIFQRQLENFGKAGDLVFTLSVSGNSPNLVKAFEWANEKGLDTIAIVGSKKGKLAEMANNAIVIDSEHYGYVEDLQMLICHIIAYAFIENSRKL